MIAKFLAAAAAAAPDASKLIQDSAAAACGTACNKALTLPGLIAKITTALVFLIGGLAVLMIIVGGLRYVVSAGDPKKVTDAKNTIMYAIAGVVVAIMAFAVIKFVTSAL